MVRHDVDAIDTLGIWGGEQMEVSRALRDYSSCGVKFLLHGTSYRRVSDSGMAVTQEQGFDSLLRSYFRAVSAGRRHDTFGPGVVVHGRQAPRYALTGHCLISGRGCAFLQPRNVIDFISQGYSTVDSRI